MEKLKPILDKAKSMLNKIKNAFFSAGKSVLHKIKKIDVQKIKSVVPKIKSIVRRIKSVIKKGLDLVLKHKRYAASGVLFVAFILLLIFATGKDPYMPHPSATGDAMRFEKNKYENVNALINKYYEAYANGDRELLSQYAEPISENEVAYIALFSSYIEKITVKNVYTQQGVTEGSYLVSVEMSIKFNGVDTEAPGLEFFYVETGRENKLYINNLYSQFNMQVNEYKKNDAVLAAIYAYNDLAELKEVQSAVETQYAEAINNDAALKEMITVTISREISAWMAKIDILVNQEPPEGNLALKEDAEDTNDSDGTVDEEQEEEIPKQEILDVDVTEKVVTVDKVNMRETADKNSNLITTVPSGTELEVIAIDSWGGWTYVQYGDMKGYIRNDLLKTIETQHSVAGLPAYPSVGQSVIIAQDQNAYVTMDDGDTVIANLKMGATVTVEMSYANGWSKVSWDEGLMVGYVPTSVLKLD